MVPALQRGVRLPEVFIEYFIIDQYALLALEETMVSSTRER